MRDWIPEGETKTAAEAFGPPSVGRDWIPAEGKQLTDDTPEEKADYARRMALEHQERYLEALREKAKSQVLTMPLSDLCILMGELSPMEREVYLEVEKEGKNRPEVFDLYGRPEREQVAVFGGVDTEAESKAPRGPEDLPLESRSPSDILHRATARQVAEQGKPEQPKVEVSEKSDIETETEKQNREDARALATSNESGDLGVPEKPEKKSTAKKTAAKTSVRKSTAAKSKDGE